MRADRVGDCGMLTLSEDDVVGLDELVEGVLLQLCDIGGRANRRGGDQAEEDLVCGVHFFSFLFAKIKIESSSKKQS